MLDALCIFGLIWLCAVNLEGYLHERRANRDVDRMYRQTPETFWQAFWRELF